MQISKARLHDIQASIKYLKIQDSLHQQHIRDLYRLLNELAYQTLHEVKQNGILQSRQ